MKLENTENQDGEQTSTEETGTMFSDLGLEDSVMQAISELGFVTPTPIQRKMIPALLGGREDMVGLAQTGTGKTAAFGLPLTQFANHESKATRALILSPTRELCVQIAKDMGSFAKYKKGIRVVPVYGGASIDGQAKDLKRGAQVIAATPGRMLDMIKRGKADLTKLDILVLDEADEMLNMGFKEELDAILETTPKTKRTLLFSATMSREVSSIAKRFMRNPIEITVGRKNEGADNVKHAYYLAHARDRYSALKRIADFHPNIYAIIFCRTRAETRDVAEKLMEDGYDADALHGDMSQVQRDAVMHKFRTRNLQMLVATDVAARGLDVDGLSHIINYNLPADPEQYVHRSGRTGRAGKSGISIAIINLKEKHKIRTIERSLGKKFVNEPIPTGRDVCEKQLFNLIEKLEKVDVLNEEIESFLPTVFKKLEWLDREELIKRFVSVEFNAFLKYYKKTQDLNVETRSNTGEMCRFFINQGKKDGLSPTFLIGMVNDLSRRLSIRVGKIDIMPSFSFFEAEAEYQDLILTSFRTKKYKGRKIYVDLAEDDGKKHSVPRPRRPGPGKKKKKFKQTGNLYDFVQGKKGPGRKKPGNK